MNLFQWLAGHTEETQIHTGSGAVWYNVEKGTWRTSAAKNDLPRHNEIGFAEVKDSGGGGHWWQFWRTGDGGNSDIIHVAAPRGGKPRHDHRVQPPERPYQGRPDPLPWPGSTGTGEGPTRGGNSPHTGDPYIPWPGTGDSRRYGGWGDPRGQ